MIGGGANGWTAGDECSGMWDETGVCMWDAHVGLVVLSYVVSAPSDLQRNGCARKSLLRTCGWCHCCYTTVGEREQRKAC